MKVSAQVLKKTFHTACGVDPMGASRSSFYSSPEKVHQDVLENLHDVDLSSCGQWLALSETRFQREQVILCVVIPNTSVSHCVHMCASQTCFGGEELCGMCWHFHRNKTTVGGTASIIGHLYFDFFWLKYAQRILLLSIFPWINPC